MAVDGMMGADRARAVHGVIRIRPADGLAVETSAIGHYVAQGLKTLRDSA